ncbi:MAG: IS1595 family transposase [Gammaproteobacteria bacterium]|nr:IS1595 family transposase [Gammaproteobacteria bacterium]
MTINTVQFQKGLSVVKFFKIYGTEQQCRDALFQARWPNGFICPECSNTTYCELGTRRLYQCHRCRHQTSLTAGTLFENTKLELTTWYLAIYLLTQHKSGLSALQLSRDLGVRYKTAWMMKQKLMQAMLERQQTKQLSDRVEIDDAYIGGERAGKRGRGAHHKVPFIAAVQTTEAKQPVTIQLRRVKGFRKAPLVRYAQTSLRPESTVWSDGLACFRAIGDAGCTHVPLVTGGGRSSAKHPLFKWVNTVLGNVKSAITSAYHGVSKKHVPRYLAEFEYRFNRRYDLPAMIDRLAFVAVRTPPMPYRLLTMAESYA